MKNKKYDQIYYWGLRYIEEHLFSNNTKMPSEHTVCRLLNCSRETVRTAYNRLEQEGLIQRHRGSGTFICKDKAIENRMKTENSTQKIALILQGRITSPSDSMIKGLQSVLQPQQIDIHVFFTDNKFFNERRLLETVSFQGYTGFIIDGVCSSLITPNEDCYKNLYKKKMPVIFYNNYYSNILYPKVVVDNQRASWLLIKELIHAGHRHITGIFVYDNIQSIEKFQGMLSTLHRHHIDYPDEYVKWFASDELLSKSTKRKIEQFLRSLPNTTAVVCGNHKIYTIVKELFTEMHKNIPNDCSVVCFDCPPEECEKHEITCTVHRGYDLGVHLGEQMAKMLHEQSIEESKYSYKMSPLLYIGNSVKQISARSPGQTA